MSRPTDPNRDSYCCIKLSVEVGPEYVFPATLAVAIMAMTNFTGYVKSGMCGPHHSTSMLGGMIRDIEVFFVSRSSPGSYIDISS